MEVCYAKTRKSGMTAHEQSGHGGRNEDLVMGFHLPKPIKPLLPLNGQHVSSQSDSKIYMEIQRAKNSKGYLKEKQ